MENTKFVKDLIKGKIVETIFKHMFTETGYFTAIPFGYENTIPQLAQFHELIKIPKIINNFNRMPDFVLISEDKKSAYIVEVKYRSKIDKTEILKTVLESTRNWDPLFLFVATKDAFYLTACNNIINKDGDMEYLPHSWINETTQKKYLKVLNEFIH